jgi:hypothetical protein
MSSVRTLHVYTLLLSEGRARILHLGGERPLHILGGECIMLRLGAWV